MPSTVTFRVDPSKVKKLDALADAMDRNRSFVMNEALDSYLEYQHWRLEQIEEGLADVKAGRTMSYDEHKRKMDAFVADLKATSQAKAKQTKASKPLGQRGNGHKTRADSSYKKKLAE